MRGLLLVALVGGGALVLACRPGGGRNTSAPGQPPQAVQEPLERGPYPTVLLAQAWFWKDAAGKSKPGPARLEIWRQTPTGWKATRLEDAESNVFHKAVLLPDGQILTIGGERALLKRWRFAGGRWSGEKLWEGSWGGKFSRLRDIEIGDVDGDGKDEYVIATHDAGVVVVYKPPVAAGGAPAVVELDRRPDTFVHEIEIGDIDGNGIADIVATPSERNRVGSSQPGQIVMFSWDGQSYQKTVVDPLGATHAKEVLVADIDGDGRADLLGSIEAERSNEGIVHPVEIRRYFLGKSGAFRHEVLATIDDSQCRFLVPGDFDGDGQVEIVAAPIKKGLFLLDPTKDAKTGKLTWQVRQFETNSSGFEHAAYGADLDGDGRPELYVAADDQHELNRYVFDPATQAFVKTRLGTLENAVFTWNITAGRL
jgi:hypothetical protein